MSSTNSASEPLVTVIIPCFNQARYLAEAIDSVRNQTYRRVEIVVVNDGSTDDSVEVAAGYSEVILVEQQNQGLSAARNRGLEASSGEMVVFLDADDRLLPVALSAGVACLSRHPACAFAYGQYQFIHADGTYMRGIVRDHPQKDPYLDFLLSNRVGMNGTVLFRRWIFDQVGAFNTSMEACEDLELYLRIARHHPVIEHSVLVAEYRRHPSSISSNGRKMLRSVRAVLEAERPHVAGNPTQRAALEEGLRRVTGFYALRLLRSALPPHINRRNWRSRIADLWWLVRSHPEGLIHTTFWIRERLKRRKQSRRVYASA